MADQMDDPIIFQNSIIASALEMVMERVYKTSQNKGWWDDPKEKGTLISLMHAELSEALEGIRTDEVSDKIPNFLTEEEELADAIIRICDYCAHFDLDLGGALIAKMKYNEGRKYRHGGKKF